MDLATLDKVNSVIEGMCGLPALIDCIAIARQKSSNQTPLSNIAFFNCCGVWWSFYFYSLGQYWSLSVALIWCCTYAIKTAFVFRYREASPRRTEQS